MGSSRENSPDWLHCFQAPSQSAVTSSLGSESPTDDNSLSEDEKDNNWDGGEPLFGKTSEVKSRNKKQKAESMPAEKKTKGNMVHAKIADQETSEKSDEPHEPKHSVWTLSSDSESRPDTSSLKEDKMYHREVSARKTAQNSEKEKDEDVVLIDVGGDSSLNEASKSKSPKKRPKLEGQISTKKKKVDSHIKKENDGHNEVAEEEISGKQIGPYVSSSSLPLLLSEKVHRSKIEFLWDFLLSTLLFVVQALVECEGDSIDLSGDVGAVGRVSFGPSEAKIEAIMNDFIQLKPQSNVYEAETMVEGTLEGFSFDSEEEADNLPKPITHQTDQDEGAEQQHNGTGKRRAAKATGAARKKGKVKALGGKPVKKVKKKTQVTAIAVLIDEYQRNNSLHRVRSSAFRDIKAVDPPAGGITSTINPAWCSNEWQIVTVDEADVVKIFLDACTEGYLKKRCRRSGTNAVAFQPPSTVPR
ncbi:hypothetical protein RJ639_001729 [Escallonia herrerae]|uniref:Uncharacterized protein n=1 Tax=Escallonia herrerae TaxID=1293975 RepID=A0AA88X8S5_9ASTE|nr:hypothetical protein RJ639_001729 [Escallonia herrerae]